MNHVHGYSELRRRDLHRTFSRKFGEYSQNSPSFFLPSPLFLPPVLLLRYSIICWLVVNDCCFRVRGICHRPGLTCGGPSWAPRQEAAIWEARAHHQSLSLGSDHLTPYTTATYCPSSSTIFNRLNVCSPPVLSPPLCPLFAPVFS